MGLNFAILVTGSIRYYRNLQRSRADDIEDRSGQMAIEPMLLAERDREYLRHLRRMRDFERDLMKDVPGWEVGTWYGKEVYNHPPDLMEPEGVEWYMFCPIIWRTFEKRVRHWQVIGA